jgi:hypothetical protein
VLTYDCRNLYFYLPSERFILVAGESYPETLQDAAFIIVGASSRVAIPNKLHVLRRDKAYGGFNPLLTVSVTKESHRLDISTHDETAETGMLDCGHFREIDPFSRS